MSEKKYLYQEIGETGCGKTKSIDIARNLFEKDCAELKEYKKIQSRPEGYCVSDHHTKIRNHEGVSEDSNQVEKRTFRKAVIDNYKTYTVDYEVNILPKEKQNIDVLFHHDGYLYMGEAKGPAASGDEPLLRAVLEIETYSRLIDQAKLFSDYSKLEWLSSCLKNTKEIKKAIIIFENKDGKISPMYRQLTEKKYEPVCNLMKKLKIYAVKAEDFCGTSGKITFFDGFSPKDY